MKGTVIKRGRKWSVVIDLGRDPVTGKRRRKWHSGFDRKKDAERARIEILGRLQVGEYVEPSRMSLGKFLLEEWLPARKATVAQTTFANYEHQVRSYIVPHLGHRPLQGITPAELNVFYAVLMEDGRRQGAGGLSAKSTRHVHAVVRKALSDAVKWNLISRNPAASADPPKPVRPEMKTWSAENVRTFLKAEEDTREYPIWNMAVTTGMRRAEVLGVPWRAVDLDTERLSITQTLVLVNGRATLRAEAKTASGRRSVELDAGTVSVLREHRRRQIEERLKAGSVWQDSGLVFCREDGTPIKPDWLTRTFNARARAAGLPKIRLHDLRHTWATLALGMGIHPKIVSERLGHSTISVTLDLYSHVSPGMDKAAAELVAALFR